MDINVGDVLKKVDTIQENALKHARMTNTTVSKEVNRMEKVISTLEVFAKR